MQRLFRPQQIGRGYVRLPAFYLFQYGFCRFNWRELTGLVASEEFMGRKAVQVHSVADQVQLSAARSFTKIGMSFQSPVRRRFATVSHCGW